MRRQRLPCLHPEHNPPTAMVYEPGTYRHTCPGCGESFLFTVNRPTWQDGPTWRIEAAP